MMSAVVCFLALALAQAPQTPPQIGSIEGLVLRAGTSEPLYRARVTLMRTDSPTPATNQPKNATTDKSGKFAFIGLERGRYNLSAQRNGFVRISYGQRSMNGPGTALVLGPGQVMKDVVFRMNPAGLITGRVYDSEGEPMNGAEVGLMRAAYDQNGQKTLQQVHSAMTNDLGEYRLYWVTPSKYYLRVNYRGFNPMMRSPNEMIFPTDEAYAPMFYPGTPDAASASMIEVLPGTQVSAVDITLTMAKTFKIRGRVVQASANMGRARPNVSVRPKRNLGGIFISGLLNSTSNPDGTFEIRNVMPGSYFVTASMGDNSMMMYGSQVPVDVGESDVEGVVLTLAPGFALRVRIYADGQAQVEGANSPLEDAQPFLRPIGDVPLNPGMPTLSADGTFTLNPVLPGTYGVTVAGLQPDFFLKAAMLGNTDVVQEGLILERPPEAPLEILVSPNGGRVEGTVLDSGKEPVRGTQVVLIPQQPDRYERYKTGSTDQNGQFVIRGITPGEYKLFAWEEIESGAFRDPEFVRQFEQLGKAVRITEGARENVELRIIPGGNQP